MGALPDRGIGTTNGQRSGSGAGDVIAIFAPGPRRDDQTSGSEHGIEVQVEAPAAGAPQTVREIEANQPIEH